MITEIIENDDNLLVYQLMFQQNGAPPHYAVQFREFLKECFPIWWIGRSGAIEWPARSPDINTLDFFSRVN